MKTKTYSQFGTFSVAILLPLFLWFTGVAIKSYLTKSPDLVVHLVLAVGFLFCLLILYRLTINIDSEYVSFKMGIGLIRKSYRITDLRSCRAVTNFPFTGIGIRMLPNGWLFNVSGLKAIELTFHNKQSIVRIGTDKPEEISLLIGSMVGGTELPQQPELPKQKKWINPFWIGSILLIIALIVIPAYRDTGVALNSDGFKIRGVYGMTIPFSEIEDIDTVAALPAISLRTNGYAAGKTLIGNFKLSDESHVKLFVKRGSVPYILIKAKGKVPVYINFKNKQRTIDLYNELKIKK